MIGEVEVVGAIRPRGAKKAAFLRNVRAGMRPREAAYAAGVAYSTYYRWAENATFRDEVQREEALCELTLVLRVQEAARRGSYRAAMFLLERRYPERWAPKERLELTGADGGPIAHERIAKMSDEDLDAELVRLRSIAEEGER